MAVMEGTFVGMWCALFGWSAILLVLDLFTPFAEENIVIFAVNAFFAGLGCLMCLQDKDLDLPVVKLLAPAVLGVQASVAKLCPLMPSYTLWTTLSVYYWFGSVTRLFSTEYPRFWGSVSLLHMICHSVNFVYQLFKLCSKLCCGGRSTEQAAKKKE
mmetsp:Transcript_97291/g.275657  ORF Transcript_97291/g.275657 Transcript_97291/m.275657 type:complete len:157 (-) Transcript_97291:120-590(-)